MAEAETQESEAGGDDDGDTAAERRTEHIPEWKRDEVEDLVTTLESYESVGIVNVEGIPSRQLQAMRRDLYGTAELRIARNTLMIRALESVDEGLEELIEFVSGQVGFVCTNENPFGLYRQLEASKTPAPINAGEVAPNDIVIPAGDTGMDPGPFVGDLQQVGANARIQEGSIRVLEESTVLSTGDEVDQTLANVLSELGIEPKEVGLDLRGVYADGVVFGPEELELDIEQYRGDIEAAAAGGRNLSVNAGYPTDRTIGVLLSSAGGRARSVGIKAAIEEPDLVDDLLARADTQLRALAVRIDDEEALPADLRDVEAAPTAAATTGGGGAEEEEQTDEQHEAEATDAAEEADDEDDDEDGGDALGEMFG